MANVTFAKVLGTETTFAKATVVERDHSFELVCQKANNNAV